MERRALGNQGVRAGRFLGLRRGGHSRGVAERRGPPGLFPAGRDAGKRLRRMLGAAAGDRASRSRLERQAARDIPVPAVRSRPRGNRRYCPCFEPRARRRGGRSRKPWASLWRRRCAICRRCSVPAGSSKQEPGSEHATANGAAAMDFRLRAEAWRRRNGQDRWNRIDDRMIWEKLVFDRIDEGGKASERSGGGFCPGAFAARWRNLRFGLCAISGKPARSRRRRRFPAA